jgi:hypothetical protein
MSCYNCNNSTTTYSAPPYDKYGCRDCTDTPMIVSPLLDCHDIEKLRAGGCLDEEPSCPPGNGNGGSTTSSTTTESGGGNTSSSTSSGSTNSNTSSSTSSSNTNSSTTNTNSSTSSGGGGGCPPNLSVITPTWTQLPNGTCTSRPVIIGNNFVRKVARSGSLIYDYDYNFYVATPISTTWQISGDGGNSWQTVASGTTSISGSTNLVVSPTPFTDNFFFLVRATNVDGQTTYVTQINPVSGGQTFQHVGGYENVAGSCTQNRFQLNLPSGVTITAQNLTATGDVVLTQIGLGVVQVKGCVGGVTGTITVTCGGNTATIAIPPIKVNGNCVPCGDCLCTVSPTAAFTWIPSSPSNPNEFLVMVTPNPIWLTGSITWSATNGMQIIGATNKWYIKVRINSSVGASCLTFSANGVCGPVSGQSCKVFNGTVSPSSSSSTLSSTSTATSVTSSTSSHTSSSSSNTSQTTSSSTSVVCIPSWQESGIYCNISNPTTTTTSSSTTVNQCSVMISGISASCT